MIIIYIVIVSVSMITVLMENRQPVKTMAWLMVMAFVPVVGIVLYFFFGQNTRKERHINQHSLDRLATRSMLEFAEQKNLQYPIEHLSLIQLFTNQSWALPFKDNEVEVFTEGYDFFQNLILKIRQARHSIHLVTYIIDDDPLGQLIADCLIDKAREGVEVRLVYDDVGCWKVKNSFFSRMKSGGVQVEPFMPVRFPAFTSKVNYRNHHKICVIDGSYGFIGGMNIAMRYLRGTAKMAWRDTHLCIHGGAVYGLQRTFLIDWYFVTGELITNRIYYPELPVSLDNHCLTQIVTSSPISQWPNIMQGYVRILLEARHYVYIETPYFLPTEPVLFALRTAALAGVDVRLMVPRHSDAKFVEWASRSYVLETLEAGVKVYLYKRGFNHSKLLVCDDTLCTCGSTNVDFRSFENNFEANAFFYDDEMALRIKDIFLHDMEHCIMIDKHTELKRLPFLQHLGESLVRLLSPLL